MEIQYVVRSVMLSSNSTALTLEPGQWMKEDPSGATETDPDDGTEYPAMIPAPMGEGDWWSDGGKLTELRFDADTDLKPGDPVKVTVDW